MSVLRQTVLPSDNDNLSVLPTGISDAEVDFL